LLATFHAFKHASEFVVWAINQLPALTSLFAAHSTTSSAATTHWAGYFAEHSNGLACVCNTVFPFDELAGMIVTVLGVWGVALLYRLIKSWLPTLA
jgi:hypothetical protein